jgi:hypothetical protein
MAAKNLVELFAAVQSHALHPAAKSRPGSEEIMTEKA